MSGFERDSIAALHYNGDTLYFYFTRSSDDTSLKSGYHLSSRYDISPVATYTWLIAHGYVVCDCSIHPKEWQRLADMYLRTSEDCC